MLTLWIFFFFEKLPVESPQGKNIERKDELVTSQLEEAFAITPTLQGDVEHCFLNKYNTLGIALSSSYSATLSTLWGRAVFSPY